MHMMDISLSFILHAFIRLLVTFTVSVVIFTMSFITPVAVILSVFLTATETTPPARLARTQIMKTVTLQTTKLIALVAIVMTFAPN